MKKKIAVVLTALMVMAMGTTAFAATSPTTKTSETTTAEATAYANVTVAAGGIVIDGVASTAAPTVKAVTTAQVEAAQTQAVASVAPILQGRGRERQNNLCSGDRQQGKPEPGTDQPVYLLAGRVSAGEKAIIAAGGQRVCGGTSITVYGKPDTV